MAFMIFVLMLALAGLWIAMNWQILKERGEARFSSRDPNFKPDQKLSFFGIGGSSPTQRKKKPRRRHLQALPSQDPTLIRSPFENTHCESCASPPTTQFTSTFGRFEFCDFHTSKNKEALLGRGFTITLGKKK